MCPAAASSRVAQLGIPFKFGRASRLKFPWLLLAHIGHLQPRINHGNRESRCDLMADTKPTDQR